MNRTGWILFFALLAAAAAGGVYFLNRPLTCVEKTMRENHTDEVVAKIACARIQNGPPGNNP